MDRLALSSTLRESGSPALLLPTMHVEFGAVTLGQAADLLEPNESLVPLFGAAQPLCMAQPLELAALAWGEANALFEALKPVPLSPASLSLLAFARASLARTRRISTLHESLLPPALGP
jgi:hypothetical protein